jgi:DNA-binding NarL/FixJ family response regulator
MCLTIAVFGARVVSMIDKNKSDGNPVIRILLVHDVMLMCNVITAALEGEKDLKILGCATNIEEAQKFVEKEDVDIVLTSTRLPENGSLRLTEAIRAHHPAVEVIVLGISENKERVLQFIEAGAAGYVLKDSSVDDLINTIRTVYAGLPKVSPEIASAMMERISQLAQRFSSINQGLTEPDVLTTREMEVLTLLGKGLTNQEIADQLVIEVGTVKNHVHNILNKLDVTSREKAAAYLALIRNRD